MMAGRLDLSFAGIGAAVTILLALAAGCTSLPPEADSNMHDAARDGRTSVIRSLLERGHDQNIRDGKLTTPIMWASYEGHVRIVQALLDAGADADAQDDMGRTALMWAAEAGRVPTTDALIDGRCNVDLQDTEGHTALMIAAAWGRAKICKRLLEAGADMAVRSARGHTACSIAQANGHRAVLALLETRSIDLAASGTGNPFLPFTIQADTVKEIRYLFWADDVQPKPYETDWSPPDVPDRVTYRPVSSQKNRAAVDEVLTSSIAAIRNHQSEEPVVLGPHLTTLLDQGDLITRLEHTRLIMRSPTEPCVFLVSAVVRGDSVPKVLSLLRNLLFNGETVRVRRPNRQELDWYWSIIGWDIDEPIFVFNTGDHSILIDFGEQSELFYVELLDGLQEK